jgi:hypothetical protein
VGQDQSYFLLGDVFLRNYYAIHDLESLRLGLVPHRYSLARIIPSSVMNVSGSTIQPNASVITASLFSRNTDPLKDFLVKTLIVLVLAIVLILIPAAVLTLTSFYLNKKLVDLKIPISKGTIVKKSVEMTDFN